MRLSAILPVTFATFSLLAGAKYYMPAPNSISKYSGSTSTEACESLNSSTATSTYKDKHTASEAITVTTTKIKTITDTEIVTCTEIKYQTETTTVTDKDVITSTEIKYEIDTKTITEKETITYSTTIFKNTCSSTSWPGVKTVSSHASTSIISYTFVPAKQAPSCTDEFTYISTAKPAPSCTDESTYTSTSTAAMKNSLKPSYTIDDEKFESHIQGAQSPRKPPYSMNRYLLPIFVAKVSISVF